MGIIALNAMWRFTCFCFAAMELASWIGLLVMVQNVVSSLFNSHLFDFHEGWMYVLGVGIAGDMNLGAKQRAGEPPGLPLSVSPAA